MKRILFVIPFIIAVTLFSCKQKNEDKKGSIKTVTQKSTIVGTVDTIVYTKENTVYHSIEGYDSVNKILYYLDTFSIADNKFRLVYTYPSYINYLVLLEKEDNDKWIIKSVLNTTNVGDEIEHNSDVNKDGYTDITSRNRFHSEVYLFNTTINNFYNNDSGFVYDKIYLIDKDKKIFCDIHQFKLMCGDIGTDLFIFKNNTRTDLYSLELSNCPDSGFATKIINKLILKKHFERKSKVVTYDGDSLVEIKTTYLKKSINLDDYGYDVSYKYFDHIAYWKSCYKELLKP